LMVARKSVVTWPRGSHGNTYGGNPISCAASLATLDLIEKEYMHNAAAVGAFALDKLRQMQLRHPSIGEVRGIGLMIGVEFVQDCDTREPAVKLRDRVVDLAFEEGLLTLGCGRSVIRVSPPLCTTYGEMEEALEIFDRVITRAEDELLFVSQADTEIA